MREGVGLCPKIIAPSELFPATTSPPCVQYHDTFPQMKSLTVANVHWGPTFMDKSSALQERGMFNLFFNTLAQRLRIQKKKLEELRIERGDVGPLYILKGFVETVVEEEKNQ